LSQSELRENAFAILEKAKDLMLDLYKRRPHIGPFESKRVAFVGDTHGALRRSDQVRPRSGLEEWT